jgi:MFS family permease
MNNIQDALTRALISIAGAALVFIAAQTLGAGLCALIRCEFENWIERFVYRAGTGFGMLSYISLGMAAMAIIQPEIISEWYVKAYEDARFILYRLVQE